MFFANHMVPSYKVYFISWLVIAEFMVRWKRLHPTNEVLEMSNPNQNPQQGQGDQKPGQQQGGQQTPTQPGQQQGGGQKPGQQQQEKPGQGGQKQG
jgi:hypothetical protein